ncbi:hypothetical protein [Undibacterium sp. TC9W]|uniref:hypothetical protein n=1 Tax=Undibacterium sp. TC9W TaxID=3413053 RepID=UPI003BF19DD9
MTFLKFTLGAISGLALAMPCVAADIYVIGHKGLGVAGADIRDVFVGDKQVEGGTKIVPLDNSAAQKDFLEKVVKVESAKYASIWAKKGFRDGLNPPAVKSGDAEVIAAVKSTPGAIGYVTSKPPEDVKLIQKY